MFPVLKMLRSRIAMGAAVVAAIAAASAAAIPQAAYAGTTGQQIRFDLDHCGGGLGSVAVSGYNQSGRSAHWSGGSANDAAYLAGWWWVGNITVSYTQRGQSHTVHAYVPQGNDITYQYWSNVVRVDCHGSWKFGSGRVVSGSGSTPSCVDLNGNLWGSYTQYYNFQGYWGKGWDQATQWSNVAYGASVPGLITASSFSIVCD